jgi:hypothetical protein
MRYIVGESRRTAGISAAHELVMRCRHTFTRLSLQDWHPVLDFLCGLFVCIMLWDCPPGLPWKVALFLTHVADNSDTDNKQDDAEFHRHLGSS